jgi:hypothetical protein
MSVREPYWPYHTPEAKRELAASYRRLIEQFGYPTNGMDPEFWDALATLQEQDRIAEWKAMHQAWKDAEPHPRDLLR